MLKLIAVGECSYNPARLFVGRVVPEDFMDPLGRIAFRGGYAFSPGTGGKSR